LDRPHGAVGAELELGEAVGRAATAGELEAAAGFRLPARLGAAGSTRGRRRRDRDAVGAGGAIVDAEAVACRRRRIAEVGELGRAFPFPRQAVAAQVEDAACCFLAVASRLDDAAARAGRADVAG